MNLKDKCIVGSAAGMVICGLGGMIFPSFATSLAGVGLCCLLLGGVFAMYISVATEKEDS